MGAAVAVVEEAVDSAVEEGAMAVAAIVAVGTVVGMAAPDRVRRQGPHQGRLHQP